MSALLGSWRGEKINIEKIQPLTIIKNIGILGHNIIFGGQDGSYDSLKGLKRFVSEQLQDSPFKDSSKILGKALVMMFYQPERTLNGIKKRWTKSAIKKYFKGWDSETITDIVLLEMDLGVYRERRGKKRR